MLPLGRYALVQVSGNDIPRITDMHQISHSRTHCDRWWSYYLLNDVQYFGDENEDRNNSIVDPFAVHYKPSYKLILWFLKEGDSIGAEDDEISYPVPAGISVTLDAFDDPCGTASKSILASCVHVPDLDSADGFLAEMAKIQESWVPPPVAMDERKETK